jgi:hypothetical protein
MARIQGLDLCIEICNREHGWPWESIRRMNDEKRINRTSYCTQWQFRLETRDGD